MWARHPSFSSCFTLVSPESEWVPPHPTSQQQQNTHVAEQLLLHLCSRYHQTLGVEFYKLEMLLADGMHTPLQVGGLLLSYLLLQQLLCKCVCTPSPITYMCLPMLLPAFDAALGHWKSCKEPEDGSKLPARLRRCADCV